MKNTIKKLLLSFILLCNQCFGDIAEFKQTFKQWLNNRTNAKAERALLNQLANQYPNFSARGQLIVNDALKANKLGTPQQFMQTLQNNIQAAAAKEKRE